MLSYFICKLLDIKIIEINDLYFSSKEKKFIDNLMNYNLIFNNINLEKVEIFIFLIIKELFLLDLSVIRNKDYILLFYFDLENLKDKII